MTTTDTDTLTERIARAMAGADGYDPDDPCDAWAVDACRDGAQAAERIVAEEVRKAKAEALREAAPLMHDFHDAAWLETQATEYETGDSDDHR